jgi:hypothetical protein
MAGVAAVEHRMAVEERRMAAEEERRMAAGVAAAAKDTISGIIA